MTKQTLNWEYLLEQNVDDEIQHHVNELGQTEGGRLVHNWLQNTFNDLDLKWENHIENGKYDAFDGDCVYEFKTKHPNVFDSEPPYDRDLSQLQKYLDSKDLNADYGLLVYINRGDLTEVDEYLYDGEFVVDL